MLESQAEAYGYGRDEELLGDKERGLDWDEFRRDQWGGDRDYVENEGEDLGGRLEKLDLVEFGESAEEKGSRRGGALLPVREPKGPDAAGRGFGGRGRGGRGGFGGH